MTASHRPLLLASLTAVLLLVAGRMTSAEEPLGVVKNQPAIGRFVKIDRGYMVPYTATIPGTKVTFEMQPIPGGKVKLGSPAGEAGSAKSENPHVEIEIEPFWIGTYEVT